jgi:hypothetical protein
MSPLVRFPGNLASLETIAQLRALTGDDLVAKATYLTQGQYAFGDGSGDIYIYDPASMAADDNILVIRPSSIGSGSPGRWLAALGAAYILFRNYLEDIPGVVEGTGANAVQNSAAINATLAQGGTYRLRQGSFIRLGQSLVVPSNSAIVADEGSTAPVFYLPSANFNNNTASPYGTNATAINISGSLSNINAPASGVKLGGFVIQSQVADGRNLAGIVCRNGLHIEVHDIEMFGFPSAKGVTISSVRDSAFSNLYFHDFASNVAYGYAPQLTGFEVDNDRVAGTFSQDLRVDSIRNYDLFCGSTFIAAHGDQATGVNDQGSIGPTYRRLHARNCAQAMDIWSIDGLYSDLLAETSRIFDLKLIHGSQKNLFTNFNFRGATAPTHSSIIIVGSATSFRDTDGNMLRNGVIDNPAGDCIYFDGNAFTYKVKNTSMSNITCRMSPTSLHGYADASPFVSGFLNYASDMNIMANASPAGGSLRISIQNLQSRCQISGDNTYYSTFLA